MGYRTDVGFCVKPGIEVPKFESFDEESQSFKNFNNCVFEVVVRDDRGTLYVALCVKWYEGYPLIDQVTNFLDSLDEDDYEFVEVDANQDGSDSFRGAWWDNDFNLGYKHELTFDRVPQTDTCTNVSDPVIAPSQEKDDECS